MPASTMPIASTTAMAPSGIASIAARVEIGEPHDAGVARSSRAGTKRKVKARPARRFAAAAWPTGIAPRIQTLRRPFFRSTVVRVAVVTDSRARAVSAARGSGSVAFIAGKAEAAGARLCRVALASPCPRG